jgi:predicted aspartyl protease
MARFTKGIVLTTALIENWFDVAQASDGRITDDQVHRIEIANARVDESETYLCMPRRLIEQLALNKACTGRDRTATGTITFPTYGPVRLKVQDRDCDVEVKEIPESRGVLLGFVVLEMLDLVVDPQSQKLVGNPDHDGVYMIDLLHQTFVE